MYDTIVFVGHVADNGDTSVGIIVMRDDEIVAMQPLTYTYNSNDPESIEACQKHCEQVGKGYADRHYKHMVERLEAIKNVNPLAVYSYDPRG